MVCPTQMPSRNIQRKMQKTTTPMPSSPQRLNSKRINLPDFFLARAINSASCYILSGADRPTTRRPLLKTSRKPSASQSLACVKSRSSEITL